MSKTNSHESDILNHSLGVAAMPFVATVYVGLFSATPNEAGGGTELSGNGYARVACTFANAGGAGSTSNSAEAVFPTATGAWATAVSAGIFDAASGGSLRRYANLAAQKTAALGEVLRFPVGTLIVTED